MNSLIFSFDVFYFLFSSTSTPLPLSSFPILFNRLPLRHLTVCSPSSSFFPQSLSLPPFVPPSLLLFLSLSICPSLSFCDSVPYHVFFFVPIGSVLILSPCPFAFIPVFLLLFWLTPSIRLTFSFVLLNLKLLLRPLIPLPPFPRLHLPPHFLPLHPLFVSSFSLSRVPALRPSSSSFYTSYFNSFPLLICLLLFVPFHVPLENGYLFNRRANCSRQLAPKQTNFVGASEVTVVYFITGSRFHKQMGEVGVQWTDNERRTLYTYI